MAFNNPQGQVLSGTRAQFYFDGTLWAMAMDVSVARALTMGTVTPLGQASVQSHELLAYDVSLSCGLFATAEDGLQTLGWPGGEWPASEDEIEWIKRALAGARGSTCDVYDQVVGAPVARLEGVQIVGESLSFSARSQTMVGVDFVARRMYRRGTGSLG